MTNYSDHTEPSSAMPDAFDRLLGALHGLPDVTSTKPSTVRSITPIIGTSQMYIVQTYRQLNVGDTIFLECVSKDGTVRLAVPPAVCDAIARQRDSLTTKVRSKLGKANAQARKDRGELMGFAANPEALKAAQARRLLGFESPRRKRKRRKPVHGQEVTK